MVVRLKAIFDIVRGKSFMTGDIRVNGGFVSGARTCSGVAFRDCIWK
jgi:hypothetical protein